MSAETETDGEDVQRFNDLWQAANHLTEGARVRVRYESKQSDKVLTKEGKVEDVVAPSEEKKEDFDLDYNLRVGFQRDDGQRMYVYATMELHTAMSMYPFVGDVVEIEVIDGIEDSVEAPEPAEDPMEKSVIAAERAQLEQTRPSDLDVLEAALDRLKELDITPKEDWSDDKFDEWMEALSDRTQLDWDSDED